MFFNSKANNTIIFIYIYRMNHRKAKSPSTLTFSQWSRKGYAVFASLGKVVRIGRIAVDVCRVAMLKTSAIKECIPALLIAEINHDEDDTSRHEPLWLTTLLQLMIIPVPAASEQYPVNNILSIHHNKRCRKGRLYSRPAPLFLFIL